VSPPDVTRIGSRTKGEIDLEFKKRRRGPYNEKKKKPPKGGKEIIEGRVSTDRRMKGGRKKPVPGEKVSI